MLRRIWHVESDGTAPYHMVESYGNIRKFFESDVFTTLEDMYKKYGSNMGRRGWRQYQ